MMNILDIAWVSVKDRLPMLGMIKGAFTETKRMLVQINHEGERYEAFAKLSSYGDLDAEWNIEGHNGNWHDRVTHWLEYPQPPKE